ncbi:MAG: alpha/beta hydrolase [Blastocatellales bacterium]
MSELIHPVERRVVQEFPCYYDLYIPEGGKPKPLLIAMHGYGGDKSSMMKLARRINESDFVIAALQGPHQHLVMPTKESPTLGYGFGWLSNFKPEESVALHHRMVNQVIDELGQSGEADTSKVFLMGFSQACGINFRYAFTNGERVRGVVAICGGIPGDWETEGKYSGDNVDVLYVAAERDEFYTPERMRDAAEALRRRARSVELKFFDAGHEVPREAYPVIDEWLRRMAAE